MKKNCWEFKQCKKELGGETADVCPASLDTRFDGIHDGICGGRTCWVIDGTLCDGSIQGDFIDKHKECGKCNFYEYVKKEEGTDLVPTVILLKRLEETR